jgi:hypothetical protein
MEVFFEIAFASSLNLYVVDWDTPFTATNYSNTFSVILFITCAVVCLFLIIFYAKNLKRINDEAFLERFSGGVEESNLKKTEARWSIVVNLGFFFGRRIAFIASVIYLGFLLWAQLFI